MRAKPKRVVFAEGEDEAVIRAAYAFQNSGLGKAAAGGPRRCGPRAASAHIGLDEHALEIRVPLSAQEAAPYIERLYKRIQRRGALYRDAVRMVTNDRNIYAASMLAAGDADAMVTGVTRNYAAALTDVRTVIDASHGVRPIGMQVIFAKGRIVLVADTSITELPIPSSWPISPSAPRPRRGKLGPYAARGDAGLVHLRLSPLGAQRTHHRSGAHPGHARRGFRI